MNQHTQYSNSQTTGEALRAQIEEAWTQRHDVELPFRLAQDHPDLAEELLDFFDQLVSMTIAPTPSDEQEEEVAQRLQTRLRQTGQSHLADAIERVRSVNADPSVTPNESTSDADGVPPPTIVPSLTNSVSDVGSALGTALVVFRAIRSEAETTLRREDEPWWASWSHKPGYGGVRIPALATNKAAPKLLQQHRGHDHQAKTEVITIVDHLGQETMSQKLSRVGDLTALAKEIEQVFERHFGGKAALAIAFTLPPDYDDCHWVTNVNRADGVKLLAGTAKKMLSQTN